jgi:hypothetical protein
MAIQEFQDVALTVDIPEHGLKAGDLGTVVDISESRTTYAVEFVSLDKKLIAVLPLLEQEIRQLEPAEIAHARTVGE